MFSDSNTITGGSTESACPVSLSTKDVDKIFPIILNLKFSVEPSTAWYAVSTPIAAFPVTSIPAPKSVLGKISMCPSAFIKILLVVFVTS